MFPSVYILSWQWLSLIAECKAAPLGFAAPGREGDSKLSGSRYSQWGRWERLRGLERSSVENAQKL